MKKLMTVALLAAALAGPPATVHARDGDVATALVAGVVGAAVGAALSRPEKQKTVIYRDRNAAPAPASAERFSPKPGIQCYDRSRSCYHRNGGFAANWTDRVYGR